MPTPSTRSPQDGFTLLEILVALAIIGFLLDSEGVTDPTVDMTGWGVDFNANGAID